MRFSESWLREWVATQWSSEELVAQLTMAGLEVDAVEAAAAPFSDVIIGEILSVRAHPNAQQLNICTVTGSVEGEVQIVCGAPNARPGIKVPFATVGAILPGDVHIQRAQLRGEDSFGMLCSAAELGLSDDNQGLWELPENAPVGQSLRAFLDCDDQLIEVDLTPNRGDCLSIRGLAREVSVLSGSVVTPPEILPVGPAHDDRVAVALSAGEACPKYVGRVIRGIDRGCASPLWLQEKLRRSGIRCVDSIVDVTNYVMLELGQPLHAFDLQKINGAINVRFAEEGESLTLLGGSAVTMTSDTLVIADQEGALAMAGVMGGADSAVGENTRDIFLESAHFKPLAIAGRARQYGLHTDASHRFERGVDPELTESAIERATTLILQIAGGKPGPVTKVELGVPDQAASVLLRRTRLYQQLALVMDSDLVVDILERLGMDVVEINDEGWQCRIPSWRFDLAIEADLIEEIARIYGYNRLPSRVLTMPLPIVAARENIVGLQELRSVLVARDYHEVITYSFVDPELQRLLDPKRQPIDVANPISSDMAVMRTGLWPGLLATLRYNLKRQQHRVRIFESGLRFLQNDTLEQQPMLAGLISGGRSRENWTGPSDGVDFYDIKGDVSTMLALSGQLDQIRWCPENHPALHPGQTAFLKNNLGNIIGYVGKLHPNIELELDLDQPVYLFELQLSLATHGQVPKYASISRFPEVRRDIAVLVDDQISADDLKALVWETAGPELTDLMFFDVYRGKGVENNRKSVGMGLTFQNSSRTLTEQDIGAAMKSIVLALENKFGASLRK